jgi:PBSX family phage terminase large subunit
MIFKKLTDKQEEGLNLLFEGYTEYLFDGGARAGKTFLIILYCLLICGIYPGMRCLLARFVFAHAKSSIWLQTILPLLQDNNLGLTYKINNSYHIIKFKNGSEIWLGGLDSKERADKILGQEYSFIFLNEAVSFPEYVRDLVKTRLSLKVNGFNNQIVYDCNPKSPMHYLFKEFYLDIQPYRCQLKWLPEDNEENLSENYITGVLDKLKGNEYKRFRKAEWAQPEGSVYTGISEDNIIDCTKDFGKYDAITIGIDFGYYSAVTIWGIKEDNAYCLEEEILVNKLTEDIIESLDKHDETYLIKKTSIPIYCDHESDRIQQIYNEGYNSQKACKEVGAGDSTVNNYNLYFDHSCKSTFQCMLSMVRQQDNFGNFLDSHVKQNDHEGDATRYALHSWKMDNSGGDGHFFGGSI